MRILLVEDHAPTREQIKHLITRGQKLADIAEAGSAEEALQTAARLRPDVVVMDIMLPGMNGIEATRRLLAAQPEARVLVLSNHAGPALVQAVLDAGALGYVRKNCASEELVPALRAVGAGKKYLGVSARG